MSSQGQLVCTFTDGSRPLPYGGKYESMPVYSVLRLVELLRGLVVRQPRVVVLDVPDGPGIYIGIGGPLAAVEVYPDPTPPPGEHRSWTAQARTAHASEGREFVLERLQHEYPASSLMPAEEVIGIVAHVVEHRELPSTHLWLSPQGVPYPRYYPERGSTPS
jgi:hypothetical protein